MVQTMMGRDSFPVCHTTLRLSPKPSRITAHCRIFLEVNLTPLSTAPVVGTPSRPYQPTLVPGAEPLAAGEIRVTILGSGDPWIRRAQASGSLLVEVGNASGGFGGGNHLSGRQQGAVALAQSQQNLVLGGVTARHGDDRLVSQLDLAIKQGQMLLRGGIFRGLVGGHPVGQQARLKGGALHCFQCAASVIEAV